MADVSHAVTVPAPPEDVFPWMLEADKVPLWVDGVSAYEVVGGGAPALGSRLRQTLTVSGLTMTAESRVVAYDAPRLAATEVETNGMEVRIEYRVEPHAEGCRVTQSIAVRPTGLKAKLIAPMVRGQMDAKLPSDLERLRHRFTSPS